MANKDIETTLKYLTSKNVADHLEEDEQKDVVNKVLRGYDIDSTSRQEWLDMNKEAIKLIKYDPKKEKDRQFPFYKASKAIYPLLQPACVQLASRLIQQIARNGQVLEFKVLGKDQMIMNPQTGESMGIGVKEEKAKRMTDYASYELLCKNETWLTDQHKICMMLAGWGTVFKEVYYDSLKEEVCFEIIPPEDIIVNMAETSLQKCRRITRRLYLTRNDIISKQNTKEFLEFDIEKLKTANTDNPDKQEASQEESPTYEVLRQFCYMDLDGDGYEEPYYIYVHKHSTTLLGIYPAFDFDGIVLTEDQKHIKYIKPKINVIDYHLIDDPEGGFYSLGLNHVLLAPNKNIIATLRQLHDSGLLANTQGGFYTKAFKTKEKNLSFKMGQFTQVDTPSTVRLQDHIMQLPFKEPSNVLLELFKIQIQAGEKLGMITDILTGDVEMQNVPATTALAMTESSTRSFKPVGQKFYNSEKREFKLWMELQAQYMKDQQELDYQLPEISGSVSKEDFSSKDLDIVPVADPTMSSEAHRFARLRVMVDFAGQMTGAVNLPEVTKRLFTGLEFPNPELLIAPPNSQAPDPKLLQVQLDAKKHQDEQQIKQGKLMLDVQDQARKEKETNIKALEAGININDHRVKTTKTIVDAHKDMANIKIQERQLGINEFEAKTERDRVRTLESKPGNTKSSS